MKADDLAKKKCVPCQGSVPPLKGKPLRTLLAAVNNGWQLVREHHLEKEYEFEDFREALDFTNLVGEMAERQNHHPDIYLCVGQGEGHYLDPQDRLEVDRERFSFLPRKQTSY